MEHNFKKKYGQNFITDVNLLKAIVDDSGISENDFVIEIGAGAGTLTREICKRAKRVVSFEIDRDLEKFLLPLENEFDNLSVRFEDFMNADVGEVTNGNEFSVVANLPYYITTAIIQKFFDIRPKTMTIMVQKEVAERLSAKSGTSDYGAMSVICQAIANIKITRVVPRTCFIPSPEVDSAVLKLEFNNNKIDKMFIEFIRGCFMAKRKTLSNNLSMYTGLSKKQIGFILEEAGLNPNARAEELSVYDFKNLYHKIMQK